MSLERMTAVPIYILIVVTGISLSGCIKRSGEAKKTEVQPHSESAATAATPAQSLPFPQPAVSPAAKKSPPPPPQPNEVQEVVARVFEKVANLDTSLSPSFVAGDFNGDGSEDLAVAVKPNSGEYGEINNEFANWILEDPTKVSLPGRTANVQPTGKPVHAEKGDTLLAIIHGVGPQGWRSPEAKQTFLLKNGFGSGVMVEAATTLRNGKDKQKLPPIRGDAIRETLAGKAGLILWTGAKYAWYSTSLE